MDVRREPRDSSPWVSWLFGEDAAKFYTESKVVVARWV
jgi:hypothetical protein